MTPILLIRSVRANKCLPGSARYDSGSGHLPSIGTDVSVVILTITVKMWCVTYVTMQSANHTVIIIRVHNTTQCHMIHQLLWYAHFIFY